MPVWSPKIEKAADERSVSPLLTSAVFPLLFTVPPRYIRCLACFAVRFEAVTHLLVSKFRLRDEVVDNLVSDFVDNLEINFLEVDIRKSKEHSDILRRSLENIYMRRREYQILWGQKLLGKNVFEEMIEKGAKKIERAIMAQESILPEKKKYSDWYAKLLANNMLVTVRWWFDHSDLVSAEQVTDMMKHHMMSGTIPTLKGKDI